MLALVLSQTPPEVAAQGSTVLFNYGAIGVCLVALAVYFWFKDKNYERRIDEMRDMEKAFRKEQADVQAYAGPKVGRGAYKGMLRGGQMMSRRPISTGAIGGSMLAPNKGPQMPSMMPITPMGTR